MNKTLREFILEAEQINYSDMANIANLRPIHISLFFASEGGEFDTSALGSSIMPPRSLATIEQLLEKRYNGDKKRVAEILDTPFCKEELIAAAQRYVYYFENAGEKFVVKFWTLG